MTLLLVIGAFQAVLLVVLLLTKREKTISDFILSGYLFLSALIILLAYLEIWNRNNNFPYPWLINLSTPLILVIGPNLWLYVKSVTKQHFRFKAIYLLTLIPFLFVLSILLTRNILVPELAKIAADQTESFKDDFSFLLIVGLIATSNIGYTVWGLFLIRRYQNAIKTYFSSTGKINLNWLRFLHISALIAYASISGLYIVDAIFGLVSYNHLQIAGFGIAALLVLVIGFFGIKEGNVFTTSSIGFDMEKALEDEEPRSVLNNEEEVFIHRLLDYMKTEKPYLNPDINLALLSAKMKVNPEYLSGVINGRLNKNFFDFINHYRVNEFKRLCKDPKNKNITLISLAYDCGFSSKATFNRVFKKEVGCTPSEYFRKSCGS